jgi:hypothetical protein
MKTFLEKHSDKIAATLSCPDRILFKGYLSPFMYEEGFERFIYREQNILFKHYKDFAKAQSDKLKLHAQQMASQAGRPFHYLSCFTHKDEFVRGIIKRDRLTSGLVCVLSTQEQSFSYRMAYGKGSPRLKKAERRCLSLYFYFLDREFGLMHIRIETWFPMTIHICINAHEWLAKKLDRHHIAYHKTDNAFTWIEDFPRAQRFAHAMAGKNWPRLLSAFARKVNPLLKTLLAGYGYYFVTHQAEFATDLIFQDRSSLKHLYPQLLRHATLCLSAEDVLTFLGRKLHGNFQGEILNDCKKRLPGARVKHRMKENWIKMYDKFGVILRIETVINHPYEFRVRRRGKRNGKVTLGWLPLPKGVAFLPRFQEIAYKANHSYLDALCVVDDPSASYRLLHRLTTPTCYKGRRRRGLHPLRKDDIELFLAALRGEHLLHGFRNRDLVPHLYASSTLNPQLAKKRSARVTRLIQLLRAHRLIRKVPRSHRYRPTDLGLLLMSAAVYLRNEDFPLLLDSIPA